MDKVTSDSIVFTLELHYAVDSDIAKWNIKTASNGKTGRFMLKEGMNSLKEAEAKLEEVAEQYMQEGWMPIDYNGNDYLVMLRVM